MLTVALHLLSFELSVFTTPIYDFFVHACCAWTFFILFRTSHNCSLLMVEASQQLFFLLKTSQCVKLQ